MKQIYRALQPIITYSAWHIKQNSYKETESTHEFTLCLKSLKIEVLLHKDNLKEDIKRMISAIKERNN